MLRCDLPLCKVLHNGKSFLATALGFQACSYGHAVCYCSSSRLFAELLLSKHDGSYLKVLNRIRKHKVFIVDDFGLEKLNDVSRMALLEINHYRRPDSRIRVA